MCCLPLHPKCELPRGQDPFLFKAQRAMPGAESTHVGRLAEQTQPCTHVRKCLACGKALSTLVIFPENHSPTSLGMWSWCLSTSPQEISTAWRLEGGRGGQLEGEMGAPVGVRGRARRREVCKAFLDSCVSRPKGKRGSLMIGLVLGQCHTGKCCHLPCGPGQIT